jgi:hypothetical protein
MALETSFVNSWESIHGIAAAAARDITSGNDPHYPLIALDSAPYSA